MTEAPAQTMDAAALIARLDRFAGILAAIVRDLPDADARWKPAVGDWSILEIVNHLADEEVEDFRARLASTLRDPAAAWAPIDPPGWAVERRYNDGDLAEAAQRFLARRRESVKWLAGLGEAPWSAAHCHEKLGELRAGDLLAAWVAHDALHLRQIARRLHQLTGRDAGGFTTAYAGSW